MLCSPSAWADESCPDAAEQAQDLRAAGKLLRARGKLIQCAREQCPVVVRNDCKQWLDDVERSLSSVVVRVTMGDRDATEAAVTVDGAAVAMDGRAVEVDPGKHVVRARLGARSSEASVVVAAGERNRAILIRFDPPAARAVKLEPPSPERTGFGTGPVILGGVGIAGLAAFGVLQLLARSELSDLESGCGATRTCSANERDPIATKFAASGVALAASGVALGGALAWFLLDRSNTKSGVSPSLSAHSNGITVGAEARF